MASEREYKFLVAGVFPEVNLLRERYSEQGLELYPRGVRDQQDVYFDTPKLALLKAGVALRQRRFEGLVLATYKGSGVVRGGLHVRDELELPYTGTWPPEIAARLEPLGVLADLEPLVELSARRDRYLVQQEGRAQAELTFDEVTGRAAAGGREVRFRELELELSQGVDETRVKTLTVPLELPGLTPHAGDKLFYTLTLMGRL